MVLGGYICTLTAVFPLDARLAPPRGFKNSNMVLGGYICTLPAAILLDAVNWDIGEQDALLFSLTCELRLPVMNCSRFPDAQLDSIQG